MATGGGWDNPDGGQNPNNGGHNNSSINYRYFESDTRNNGGNHDHSNSIFQSARNSRYGNNSSNDFNISTIFQPAESSRYYAPNTGGTNDHTSGNIYGEVQSTGRDYIFNNGGNTEHTSSRNYSNFPPDGRDPAYQWRQRHESLTEIEGTGISQSNSFSNSTLSYIPNASFLSNPMENGGNSNSLQFDNHNEFLFSGNSSSIIGRESSASGRNSTYGVYNEISNTPSGHDNISLPSKAYTVGRVFEIISNLIHQSYITDKQLST